MNWQFTPYVIPLLLSALLGGGVALSAWKRRNIPGAVPLFWLAVSTASWAVFNIMELSSPNINQKILFSNVEYIFIVSIPVLWVLFALDYSGLDVGPHSSRQRLAMLSIVPAVTLALVWSNQWHGLIRREVAMNMAGPFLRLQKTYGPWFWIHTAYSYALIAFGSLVIGHTVFTPSQIYRSQAIILMVGATIPLIANIAYLIGRGDAFLGFDITITAMAVSAGLFEIGIAKTGLMSIMRIAREYVLDEIDNVVIVTDTENRIVDLNLAAQSLLGTSMSKAVGQDISEAFGSIEGLPSLEHATLNPLLTQPLGPSVRISCEIPFIVQGEQRFYDIRISPLNTGSKAPRGKLITAKDISNHKRTYQTLEHLQHELREQAIRDPLTGLYNRRGLAESLLTNIEAYKETSTSVSVVMTDINGFKEVNDRYGHYTGDQVLKQIADILQELCKPSGIAVRYGGDEFVLIIPDSQVQGEEISSIIKDAIDKWNEGNSLIQVPITMAIGVARFLPYSSTPVEACLRKADSLMYKSKQSWRH
jgi:diguanylate cyclase (GGDEF)-like protein/PAS domain S-box-containing protein